MRTKLFNALKVSTLALLLSFGLSFVYAWTAPTVSAPNGNVSAPINTSSTPQIKAGGLTVGMLDTGTGNITGYNVFINSLTALGTIDTAGLKVQNGAGTAGQVLTSDASGNATWTATSSATLGLSSHGKKRFTTVGAGTCPSATNCFTTPAGVTTVWVSGSGGGGGGGAISSAAAGVFYTGAGGGGAAAATAEQRTVTSESSIPVTIGDGGNGGSGAGGDGVAGGTSNFGSLIPLILNGGVGGLAGGTTGGTTGGTGGSNGGGGVIANTGSNRGGAGGGSIFGASAPGVAGPRGIAGGGFGAGGSGAGSSTGGGFGPVVTLGGNGAPGFVLVEW